MQAGVQQGSGCLAESGGVMVTFAKAATILDKSNSERMGLFSVQFEGAVHHGIEVAAGAEGIRSRHRILPSGS